MQTIGRPGARFVCFDCTIETNVCFFSITMDEPSADCKSIMSSMTYEITTPHERLKMLKALRSIGLEPVGS